MKKCKACGMLKPEGEFYAHKTSKDGLRSKCKPCHLATEVKPSIDFTQMESLFEKYWAYDADWMSNFLATASVVHQEIGDFKEQSTLLAKYVVKMLRSEIKELGS